MLLAIAILAVALLLALQGVGFLLYLRTRTPHAQVQNALEPRLAALELKVDGLPSLWADERERAEKAAHRARTAARRAQKLAEQSGEELDTSQDLFELDARASAGGGVPAVHENVAGGDRAFAEVRDAIAQTYMKPFLGKH